MERKAYQKISFIPILSALDSYLRQRPGLDPGENHLQERYLEQLPYALSASAHALIRLCELQEASAARVLGLPREPNSITTRQLEDYEWHDMAFAVDGFLNGARRAQNSIWVYLSKVLGLSIPTSLKDIVNSVERRKINLPDDLSKIIIQYWKTDGEKLKAYRDVSQHHAVVASDARVTVDLTGQAFVYLVLPNNPETKTASSLSYENPRIDAIPYLVDNYQSLYRFICEVLQNLSKEVKLSDHRVFYMGFKGVLKFTARPQGAPLIDVKRVIEELEKMPKSLSQNNEGNSA